MKKFALTAILVLTLSGCANNTASTHAPRNPNNPATINNQTSGTEVRDGIRTTREGVSLVKDIQSVIN